VACGGDASIHVPCAQSTVAASCAPLPVPGDGASSTPCSELDRLGTYLLVEATQPGLRRISPSSASCPPILARMTTRDCRPKFRGTHVTKPAARRRSRGRRRNSISRWRTAGLARSKRPAARHGMAPLFLWTARCCAQTGLPGAMWWTSVGCGGGVTGVSGSQESLVSGSGGCSDGRSRGCAASLAMEGVSAMHPP
jgi:hypothetical protein